jgi:hypothetical protein
MKYLHFIPMLLIALFLAANAQAQFLGGVPLPFAANVACAAGKSLIFTSASSQYLTATGKTNINQQKFTVSTFIKLASATPSGTPQYIYFASDGSDNNTTFVALDGSNRLEAQGVTSGSSVMSKVANTAITDINWHSLVYAFDTTQATPDNRAEIFLDTVQVSSWNTDTNPTLNANLSNNYADAYVIGGQNVDNIRYLNAKLTQTYYIDGQQLPPSSFVNVTCPKTFTGSYTGHFDFFLSYANGTSTTTLGADGSGESNNWTLNNMTTANQSTYP